jgi:hypothetical protein
VKLAYIKGRGKSPLVEEEEDLYGEPSLVGTSSKSFGASFGEPSRAAHGATSLAPFIVISQPAGPAPAVKALPAIRPVPKPPAPTPDAASLAELASLLQVGLAMIAKITTGKQEPALTPTPELPAPAPALGSMSAVQPPTTEILAKGQTPFLPSPSPIIQSPSKDTDPSSLGRDIPDVSAAVESTSLSGSASSRGTPSPGAKPLPKPPQSSLLAKMNKKVKKAFAPKPPKVQSERQPPKRGLVSVHGWTRQPRPAAIAGQRQEEETEEVSLVKVRK